MLGVTPGWGWVRVLLRVDTGNTGPLVTIMLRLWMRGQISWLHDLDWEESLPPTFLDGAYLKVYSGTTKALRGVCWSVRFFSTCQLSASKRGEQPKGQTRSRPPPGISCDM